MKRPQPLLPDIPELSYFFANPAMVAISESPSADPGTIGQGDTTILSPITIQASALGGFLGRFPARLVPPADWPMLLRPLDMDDTRLLLARESHLPRIVVGLLAGAQLALLAASLWYRDIARHAGAEGVAFLGAGIAILLVFLIGRGGAASPTRMIVAGIFVSLYAGALSGVLVLFNSHYLTGIFLWSSGSLIQNGWNIAIGLALRMALACVLAALLVRPLALLSLGGRASARLAGGAGGATGQMPAAGRADCGPGHFPSA